MKSVAGIPAPEQREAALDPHATRARVQRFLLETGPSTAGDVACALGLTAAGVRRHLDALVADGSVERRERPPFGPLRVRGRGRPAAIFSVTESGREQFGQAYDLLASDAMRFIADEFGEAAVESFARRHVSTIEARYLPLLPDAAPEQRAYALADALSADGYAASVTEAGGAVQMCQHHCPIAHVAADFPELCEAEADAFARLLGTHVQRLATIARGDGVCTTHIPHGTTASTPAVTSNATAPQGRTHR